MLTTVVLDVGETLVDETAHWTAWAQHLGVPAFTLFAALGGLVARGQDHREVVRLVRPDTDFATEQPRVTMAPLELYPDALPCLQALHAGGWRTVVGGNQPEVFQRLVEQLGLPVDLVTSSGELGAEKPSPEFYARLAVNAGARPEECVHVGDRADNDLAGAAAAGMTVVHLRRGPWALLHPPQGGYGISSLAELPPLLGELRSRTATPAS